MIIKTQDGRLTGIFGTGVYSIKDMRKWLWNHGLINYIKSPGTFGERVLEIQDENGKILFQVSVADPYEAYKSVITYFLDNPNVNQDR